MISAYGLTILSRDEVSRHTVRTLKTQISQISFYNRSKDLVSEIPPPHSANNSAHLKRAILHPEIKKIKTANGHVSNKLIYS